MGCSVSVEEKESNTVNAVIEKVIKEDGKKLRDEVKMLLLGSGESGKSTILKQMKLIHSEGYTDAEKKYFKEVVFTNIVQSMKAILEAMQTLGIGLGNLENDRYRRLILEMAMHIDSKTFPVDAGTAITALWSSDSGVMECFNRAQEYQLNDSSKYYFEAMARICKSDYIPTEQDILRSRVKTTSYLHISSTNSSIIETTFYIGDLTYRLFDVGGQRSERRKWIHCFDSVKAILFLVAISEYDQTLYEDKNTNRYGFGKGGYGRLKESGTLFESICNSKWFVKTSMILFLNKKDGRVEVWEMIVVFEQKILKSPIEKFWPDYTGGSDYDEATAYMEKKFNDLNTSKDKKVYTHFTCATDTDQVKVVMEAVYDIVVQANLRECGLV